MVRGAPTALNVFFVDFRTDLVISARVSVGLENPKGTHPLRPPPLGYVPAMGT